MKQGQPTEGACVKGMALDAVGCPLRLIEREMPRPGAVQVLVEVSACVEAHPLAEANAVLQKLRRGDLTGAAVLVPQV
jgi:hypothetical protein